MQNLAIDETSYRTSNEWGSVINDRDRCVVLEVLDDRNHFVAGLRVCAATACLGGLDGHMKTVRQAAFGCHRKISFDRLYFDSYFGKTVDEVCIAKHKTPKADSRDNILTTPNASG